MPVETKATDSQLTTNPFIPGNNAAYQSWRAAKLAAFPKNVESLVVSVADPGRLSVQEIEQLTQLCRAANMVIYATAGARVEQKSLVTDLGATLGLTDLDHNPLADEDSISSIQVVPGKSSRGYIPYTSRRLLWHTDGYYNPPARQIRSFLLHCVRPAADGGDNGLLDHEMAYLMLRDENPGYVEALMHPQAMTIPANTEDESQQRPAQTGPVFSIDSLTGKLYMRYTARTRSIEWRDDKMTQAAVMFLSEILAHSPYLFRYRLKPGEGIICNNVIHSRSEFRDDAAAGRLVYRARYYNRVAGT